MMKFTNSLLLILISANYLITSGNEFSKLFHRLSVHDRFEEFSRDFADRNLEESNKRGCEDVGDKNINLIDIVSQIHPWVKDEKVKSILRNSKPVGPFDVYSIEFKKHSFVRFILENKVLRGSLVSFYKDKYEMKNLESSSAEEIFFEFQSLGYKNSSGTFITSFTYRDDKLESKPCESVFLKSLNPMRLHKSLLVGNNLDMKGHFLRPIFKIQEDEVGWDIPKHLGNEILLNKDNLQIITALVTLNCIKGTHAPLRSMIVDQDLLESTLKEEEKFSTIHPYWKKRLDNDPQCRSFSKIIWPRPGSLHRTTLACFPGSGSKWIMEMVQFASGIGTIMESSQFLPPLIYKSHHDSGSSVHDALFYGKPRKPDVIVRLKNLVGVGGRAVLVIRCPYDALISWWNHYQTKSSYSQGLDDKDLEESLRNQEFCEFAHREIEMWKLLYLDYITLVPDLLILHYENIKKDPIGQLKRLLSFLLIPVHDKRLECLGKHPYEEYKRATKNKRQHLKNIFCPGLTNAIEDSLGEVNEALRENLFEPMPS